MNLKTIERDAINNTSLLIKSGDTLNRQAISDWAEGLELSGDMELMRQQNSALADLIDALGMVLTPKNTHTDEYLYGPRDFQAWLDEYLGHSDE